MVARRFLLLAGLFLGAAAAYPVRRQHRYEEAAGLAHAGQLGLPVGALNQLLREAGCCIICRNLQAVAKPAR